MAWPGLLEELRREYCLVQGPFPPIPIPYSFQAIFCAGLSKCLQHHLGGCAGTR